jgi:hypothetical protein
VKNDNENTLMVHPVNVYDLSDYIVDRIVEPLPIDSRLYVPHDALIEVKGGYILINADCMYQTSQTELWAGHIVETVRLSAQQRHIRREGTSTFTNTVRTFSYVLPGHDVKAILCEPMISLKNFMMNRGRHDYNPRIIKNKNELIKIVNQINNQ